VRIEYQAAVASAALKSAAGDCENRIFHADSTPWSMFTCRVSSLRTNWGRPQVRKIAMMFAAAPFLVSLTTTWILFGATAATDAFTVPDPPLDVMYNRMYFTWPVPSLYCVMTANVQQTSVENGGSPNQMTAAGCIPPSSPTSSVLVPLPAAQYTATVNAVTSTVEASALLLAQAVPPADALNGGVDDGGVTLVIDAPIVDVPALYAAIGAFNSDANIRAGRGMIRGGVFQRTALVDVYAASTSPLSGASPYDAPRNWTAAAPTSGMIWRNLGALSFMAIDTAADGGTAWATVQQQAVANAVLLTQDRGSRAFNYAAELSFPMFISKYGPSADAISAAKAAGKLLPTCLSQRIPSCLPVGGQSVFGSTHKVLPSLVEDPGSLPLASSPRRTILIVLPASTTATFHDAVPGANDAASSIVAGLLLADSITSLMGSYLRTSAVALRRNASNATLAERLEWSPTQLAFLFPTGDDYGLAGSARFVRDVYQGAGYCVTKPREGSTDGVSCVLPWTQTTNFTDLSLGEFTHVITLHQLAVPNPSNPKVVLHVDAVPQTTNATGLPPSFDFGSSPAQADLVARFRQSGAVVSSVLQLPPTSAFAFYGFAASKNAALSASGASSNVTSSDVEWENRWAGASRTTTLSVVSGYDSSFPRTFQSSADVPAAGNVSHLRLAAQTVVDVLLGILADEFDAFAANPFPTSDYEYSAALSTLPLASWGRANFSAQITLTLTTELWECFASDLACPYLTQGLGLGGVTSPRPPNYYPGVFGLMDVISTEQRFVYYTLLDLLEDPANPVPGSPACNACPLHSDCVRGRCVVSHSWYHHALSPALNFVRSGNVYFVQSGESFAASEGGPAPLYWGLRANILRSIWVESFWDNIGVRSGLVQSSLATAWIPSVGAVTVVLCILFDLARRRWIEHAKTS
jgi:hypothetical protein